MPHERYHDQDQDRPRDDLDLQHDLARQSLGNPLLRNTNMGTGHYTTDTLWQQIRSYRKGLFAYIAFGGVLEQRALYEAKLKLGRDGYTHYNESENDVRHYDPVDEDDIGKRESSWTAELRRGEEIWENLGEAPRPITEKQIASVIKKTGVEPGSFLPVYWQMVSGRHDASKSLEAELLRDFLTDKKFLADDGGDSDTNRLLQGVRDRS